MLGWRRSASSSCKDHAATCSNKAKRSDTCAMYPYKFGIKPTVVNVVKRESAFISCEHRGSGRPCTHVSLKPLGQRATGHSPVWPASKRLGRETSHRRPACLLWLWRQPALAQQSPSVAHVIQRRAPQAIPAFSSSLQVRNTIPFGCGCGLLCLHWLFY
jgi:hypothetical protein